MHNSTSLHNLTDGQDTASQRGFGGRSTVLEKGGQRSSHLWSHSSPIWPIFPTSSSRVEQYETRNPNLTAGTRDVNWTTSPYSLHWPAQTVQNNMAKEYFSNCLNHPTLQQHLLTIPTKTLTDAILPGRRFLQIKSREKSTLGRAIWTMAEEIKD